ncbi:MAG: ATP-binding cassette domain-containing protein [Flavobacteriales bacterium]|nr:ATP-binding cassette domain-containing protein [Flavobacteriales bacterium]
MLNASLHKEIDTAHGKIELSVDFALKKGAVTSIYGDSGVGKTMILRMLAGLTTPDGGTVKLNDIYWFGGPTRSNLSLEKRKVGFVFQDYGLFPNMSIEENLKFAVAKGEESFIQTYMDAFGLTVLKNRRPGQLSGGQKQRTAIARALICKPKVLLLDEPFTAQDKQMSAVVGQQIKQFTKEQHCVTVLVTHDIAATLKMSSYIYEIRNGSIAQEGTFEEVFLGGSQNERQGLHGIIADKQGKDGREWVFVLVNEQILEIKLNGEVLEIGDEVYLQVEQESGRVSLKKL